MPEYLPLEIPEDGKLTHNLVWFIRALRKAGLKVGPGHVLRATRALAAAGFTERRDFYQVLQAVCVSRPEERVVFAQVFRLFWRDPRYLEHMISMLTPAIRGVQEERAAKAAEKRAAEALLDGTDRDMPELPKEDGEEEEIEIDASATSSGEEQLKTLDFEQMSTVEIAKAKRVISELRLPVPPLVSRRYAAQPLGARIDARATLRRSMRHGGEMRNLARRDRRMRWPNLVALCDISGSMSVYSRMVLHFLHAVSNREGQGWAQVHAFTFGTRLTNITRHMRARDVDAALAAAGSEAQDWEGGTRIGDCLRAFNRDWSRRVLGQGAVVLLISDGLDRGDAAALAAQMERLHLTARQVIWLNPLLRYDGFAPKAAGIQAMLPHIDRLHAGHSINAFEDLAAVLAEPAGPRRPV